MNLLPQGYPLWLLEDLGNGERRVGRVIGWKVTGEDEGAEPIVAFVGATGGIRSTAVPLQQVYIGETEEAVVAAWQLADAQRRGVLER